MITLLALLPQASAQDGGGFDAHGFRLSTADADLRDPLTFVRPGDQSGLDWYVGGVVGYASRPLVFEPDPNAERVVALSNVVATNLAAGVVPFDPIRLDLSVPVFLASTGVDGAQPAGLGDLRLSAGAIAAQPEHTGGFGLGLLASLDLPTGDREAYLGEGGLSGDLGVTGTVEADALTASWRFGGRFTTNNAISERPAPTRGGDSIQGALGIGFLATEHVGVTAEAHLTVPIDAAVRTAIGVPAEALLSGRYVLEGGGHVMGGLGVGLGQGAGASPLRIVVGGGFGTGGGPPPDTDGDGLLDNVDLCPDQPEPVNGYKDDDGCPDDLPTLEIIPEQVGGIASDASLLITDAEGRVTEVVGMNKLQGLPGTPYKVEARGGPCALGSADGRIPLEGDGELRFPIVRQEGTVTVSVTDGASRPLEGATVRYVPGEPECGPAEVSRTLTGGKGTDTMGIGTHMVLITAPGYDVHQEEFTLEVNGRHAIVAKLSPTQVRVDGKQIVVAAPITWAEGASELSPAAVPLLAQVASTVLVQQLPTVKVVAYTDAKGKGGKKLSLARAQAVVDHLVSLGIEPDRFVAEGASGPAKGNAQVELLLE